MLDIERYSQSLIDEMIRREGSGVHFIPLADCYGLTYQCGGERFVWKKISTPVAIRLISHFKYRSGMNIGERRRPQSASMRYDHASRTYSLRLSTLPANGRESLAIRLLPHTTFQTVDTIPLLSSTKSVLCKISQLEQGLCLISGPTGSGKTTTLYAIVEQLIAEQKKMVITIEDPIERPIASTVQVEVNEKAGLTFANILRASLRHDPDAMLIGEIRDEETAMLAIRAALTGHLILATVHASNSVSAVLRMLHFGISKSDLASCLRYVLSQRLVRLRCAFCKDRSPYCHYCFKRGALFDVLAGEALYEAIFSPPQKIERRFYRQALKAWMLGYVGNDELKRVAYET